MPRGDRTGPEGKGPLTGRKLGFCLEDEPTGQDLENMGFGRGLGLGRGRRRRKSDFL